MCDTPTTLAQAKSNFLELANNVSSRKKALATAETKLTAAKDLILKSYSSERPDDTFKIEGSGFTINIGKQKKNVAINDVYAVRDALEAEEAGLGKELMKISYSITDLRANLSDRQIGKLTTASYGSRVITVKVG